MRHKYIIFYEYTNGKGHVDYKGKKIKSSDDLVKISKYIKDNTNEDVIITGFTKVGLAWK